jgi:uncharacterized metal-binding protein YceD (DUF177 family)
MTAPSPMPEFSRPVATLRLGTEPMVYELVANAAERAALARRFDIVALDHFAATVRLERRGRDILLSSDVVAELVQLCGVTLEPFTDRITDSAAVLYRREPPPEPLAVEDEDYELLAGDTIDIGEAVAQQLSLALPAFPRAPGATVPALATDEGEIPASVQSRADESIVPHPFAELAKLAKK